MHASAPPTDGRSPSAVADLVLVAALIGVLMGLAWGVAWLEGAPHGATDAVWPGALPPAVAAVSSGVLLAVRRAYGDLPRLRRFLARVGWAGIVGAVVLAVFVAHLAF